MAHLSVSDLQLEKEKEVQVNRSQGQDNTMMRELKVLERMHLKFRWSLDLKLLILVGKLQLKSQAQANITQISLQQDINHQLLVWEQAKEMVLWSQANYLVQAHLTFNSTGPTWKRMLVSEGAKETNFHKMQYQVQGIITPLIWLQRQSLPHLQCVLRLT